MDDRTQTQLTAHHPVERYWRLGQLRWHWYVCSCGLPWERCPDAADARTALAPATAEAVR